MGESMSKRLKLQLGGEAEMEERAFANPYPDYQPHGAAAAAAPSTADAQRDKTRLPPEEESLPFSADGKVTSQLTLLGSACGILLPFGRLLQELYGVTKNELIILVTYGYRFFPFLTLSFYPVSCFQVSVRFSKRIQTKIKDLLQQMEEGLKTADPHDCSAYTGWTGSLTVELSGPCVYSALAVAWESALPVQKQA
ncbi:hypothetical protein QYF61_018882 [Mycteria americana]|uniref:Uncharacterized protein n=1 Tax=Mycteria americana TaxID=33587 RepID=A0AAN7SGL2_MYCAM|nr:hypothetical protein QYF61_018882 [Mycteria americana]